MDDGVSVLQTQRADNDYSEINGFVGVQEDNLLFFMTKSFCDELIKKANGDYSVVERVLGYPEGYLENCGGLVRIDAENSSGLNIRIPSGNERGANELWLPGGYTSGGVPEAVTNTIPLDNAQITKLNFN